MTPHPVILKFFPVIPGKKKIHGEILPDTRNLECYCIKEMWFFPFTSLVITLLFNQVHTVMPP